MEQHKSKKNPEKLGKYKQLLGHIKRSNICITGVPEGEEKDQEIGNLFERIMKENFPNLVNEIDMQVQETQSPKTR